MDKAGMEIWRIFEFRGRDLHDNPFVDFGFVRNSEGRLAVSSHLLREPLWVNSASQVLACFKQYYETQGVSPLRYKILWDAGRPIDSPFAEGWETM